MNLDMIFGDFPVLESEDLVLRKIEDVHLQEVFNIYDNEMYLNIVGLFLNITFKQ